ncbi:MAG: hypothetical protein U5L72_10460, partial [Bacteroidales bacterium]|nr:hypothetical protein [Bacteroidales bacterium]
EIIGNVDMAISGNVLFADSYIDLLAIDITDVEIPIKIDRVDVPGDRSGKGNFGTRMPTWVNEGRNIGWEVKKITEDEEYNQEKAVPWEHMDFVDQC